MDVLDRLKESGKRLRELLNITDKDIQRALGELRKEWEDSDGDA